MKLKFLLSALSFVAVLQTTKAQNVGINSTGTAPDNSAMLDVSSTTKGMLTPRMTQAQRNAIGTPATGLLIYQTDNTAGFYHYDGTVWTLLATGANNDWKLVGNTGTTAGTDFLGTTDAQALVFKTNNTEKMRITSTGSVGINNNAPAQPLDVTGNVQFSGSLMPGGSGGTTGQILTSAGANNANVWLGQGTTGQVLTSAGVGAVPTWGGTKFSILTGGVGFAATANVNYTGVNGGSTIYNLSVNTSTLNSALVAPGPMIGYIASSDCNFAGATTYVSANTANRTLRVQIYKYTPVNGSTAVLTGTLLGQASILCVTANANYRLDVPVTVATINRGDLIICVYATTLAATIYCHGTMEFTTR